MKLNRTSRFSETVFLALFCLGIWSHMGVAEEESGAGDALYDRGMTVFRLDPEAAMSLFAKSAKKGHTKSMIRLGYCYQMGQGVKVHQRNALSWYKKAVDAGDLSAQYQMGKIYEEGSKRKGSPEYESAIEWYEKAVEDHSLKACAGLARIYASALDVAFHDGEKAIKYASILVRKNPNDPAGLALLAAGYARNIEFNEAIKMAVKAAAVSSLDSVDQIRDQMALYKEGKPFPPIASDVWMLQAAEKNSLWALMNLSERWADELDEMYDIEKAREGYEKAVEEGSKLAQIRLGKMCYKGEGGEINYKKAFWCLKETADAGMDEAFAPFARMYVAGKGTSVNLKEARIWYDKAWESRNREVGQQRTALRDIHIVNESAYETYKRGVTLMTLGGELAFRERVRLVFANYWVAAEQGNVDAMQALANLYFYGPASFSSMKGFDEKFCMRINYVKAMEWYELLRKKGIDAEEYAECRIHYIEVLTTLRARKKRRR